MIKIECVGDLVFVRLEDGSTALHLNRTEAERIGIALLDVCGRPYDLYFHSSNGSRPILDADWDD